MQPEGAALIRAVASSLRLGMDAQGNEAFVQLVDWLGSHPSSGTLMPRIEPVLAEIVAAQERGDTLRLADLLEFELQPRLQNSDKEGRS